MLCILKTTENGEREGLLVDLRGFDVVPLSGKGVLFAIANATKEANNARIKTGLIFARRHYGNEMN
jgi:hypothetical protein